MSPTNWPTDLPTNRRTKHVKVAGLQLTIFILYIALSLHFWIQGIIHLRLSPVISPLQVFGRIHMFIHSFTNLLLHTFKKSFIHLFIWLSFLSFIHLIVYLLIYTYSLFNCVHRDFTISLGWSVIRSVGRSVPFLGSGQEEDKVLYNTGVICPPVFYRTSFPSGPLPCFISLHFTITQSRATGIADHILPLGDLLRLLLLPRCPCDLLQHCSCPPARDQGSHVSGHVLKEIRWFFWLMRKYLYLIQIKC